MKLNGRTYHFLPPASNGVGPSGGLSYFTFDSRAALAGHAQSRNEKSKDETTDIVREALLFRIYEEMRTYNELAMEVAEFGRRDHQKAVAAGVVDSEMPRARAKVNMQIIKQCHVHAIS